MVESIKPCEVRTATDETGAWAVFNNVKVNSWDLHTAEISEFSKFMAVLNTWTKNTMLHRMPSNNQGADVTRQKILKI